MKIDYLQNFNSRISKNNTNKRINYCDTMSKQYQTINNQSLINFKGGFTTNIKGAFKYLKAQEYAAILSHFGKGKFLFRNLAMERLEGLQYGIKLFKGFSMNEIRYLSEFLHVIAVKRGCNNMCGHCYADAKPSKREMSWEDFKTITRGFKHLRKRLFGLPLFGEDLHKAVPDIKDEPIYKTTELFYDADCMNIIIKDKKGRSHDFTELATELHKSLGRQTVFDTSGWDPSSKLLQERAEKYVEYFSKPKNMDTLNAFNLSFNTFNASYIMAVKALKNGDREKYLRLRNKYTDRIANAIYTFSPLLTSDKFNIIQRSFGFEAKNAKYFNIEAMLSLTDDVLKKTEILYRQDLSGKQKYVKTEKEIDDYINIIKNQLCAIDTGLNSSGRMQQFMRDFKIKAPMQDHTETTELMKEDLKTYGRYYRNIAHKFIDADGKVYHMDYARFFPTELQLNIDNKTPTPQLANLKDFTVTRELLNRTYYADEVK